MTQQDYDEFAIEFRRLSASLERWKQTPAELTQRADAYFHVLKKFPLNLVRLKADAWLATQTKFPKPAEWSGQMVRGKSAEVRVMAQDETADYLRAERLSFSDDVLCDCRACVDAGLRDRAEHALRFTPIEDADGQIERVLEPKTNRIVGAGAWLHGWPLVRWYQARATFYADAYARLGLTKRMIEKGAS